MDKIWGETKYKIGDIVFVENTLCHSAGVVVDIMLSWDGQIMYGVFSLSKKDWCGAFSETHIKPYTLTYQSIGRYDAIGVTMNALDDEKTENRLKDIVAGKTSAEIDKDYAQKLLTYIARWKQCYIMVAKLYDEAEERAKKNESDSAD